MDISNLSVINGPLLEPVQFKQVSLEGYVADKVKSFAGVTATGSREDRIAATFHATTSSGHGVRVVSLRNETQNKLQWGSEKWTRTVFKLQSY